MIENCKSSILAKKKNYRQRRFGYKIVFKYKVILLPCELNPVENSIKPDVVVPGKNKSAFMCLITETTL